MRSVEKGGIFRLVSCPFGLELFLTPPRHRLSLFPPSQAFAPHLTVTSRTSLAPLFSCRVNAKKEKIKRNRENMRKFKTAGRRGTSRRKIMKKALSTRARQEETEFINKCFMTAPVSEEGSKN